MRYDTSTVIDLVHAADLYLWGGAGFGSGKVSYLWTQRDELFKSGSTLKALSIWGRYAYKHVSMTIPLQDIESNI